MKISKIALKKAKNNNRVIARLMLSFDLGSRAIEYWFQNNNYRLTTDTAVQIIKEETGLTEEQILKEPSCTKKSLL